MGYLQLSHQSLHLRLVGQGPASPGLTLELAPALSPGTSGTGEGTDPSPGLTGPAYSPIKNPPQIKVGRGKERFLVTSCQSTPCSP